MSKRRAFTLIELLVVISIIALLISILLPALRKARQHAKFVQCAVNQRSIVAAGLAYTADLNGWLPPSIAGKVSGTTTTWFYPNYTNYQSEKAGGTGMNGGWIGKHLLAYMPTGEFWFCPMSPSTSLNAAEAYRTGMPSLYLGSYSVLWGYGGAAHQTTYPKPQINRLEDAYPNSLMISDMMFIPGSRAFIRTSHPFDGSQELDSLASTTGVSGYQRTIDISPPRSLQLNSAYVDGHAEAFDATDAVEYAVGNDGYGGTTQTYYLPVKD